HAGRPGIVVVILAANIERHDAGGGDPHSRSPARDPGAERIDDAGAIHPRDERKHGGARALVAGPQAHVEHAIDSGGMNADAYFARARLGVRHVLVFEHVRRAIVVDDDRLHTRPSSVRIFRGVEIARTGSLRQSTLTSSTMRWGARNMIEHSSRPLSTRGREVAEPLGCDGSTGGSPL